MIRRRIFAATAGLAALTLAAPPLAAQDAGEEAVDLASDGNPADSNGMDEAMALFGAMFKAEPLTPEQEARLPQAQRVVGQLIPEGTLGEMMGSMFDKMLGPIMEMGGSPATATVASGTGLSTYSLDLTTEQTEELASLFDPAWAERQKREMAMFPGMMTEMMNTMEPVMRKAMSELYAINFTAQELTEIEAFFATETGASFARKSFSMSSDPRILGATMEAMPAMMGTIGSIEQKMAEATADLPAKRSFADLSAAEKARVAEVTGYSVEEIEANLSATAEASWEAMEAAEAAAEEPAAE